MTGSRKTVARRRRPKGDATESQSDEPSLDGFEIDASGHELIIVEGRTKAGFAYGATAAELRRENERSAPGAGWARAKYVLGELLEAERVLVREIGWVKKIGDGLSREIFRAEVELGDGRVETYAVALPRRDADPDLDDRTRRELRLLAKLRHRTFPFALPKMVGAVPAGDRLALVRRFVPGLELDMRAGRQSSVRPWEIIGEVAAAVHAVPGSDVEDVTHGFATRRAHALDAIEALADLAPVEMQRAHEWACEHLPSEDPSTLIHGDLLGQNILLSLDGPHHVIDWEYAMRGDPAYDLAIVTRGAKRPFQIDGGMERLLDAYRAHGGREVTAAEVQVHELCMIANDYREAAAGRRAQAPEHERDRMRGFLRRLR
jgi:aminoglycoside phosphotransferase (APT) family kinase protein